MVKVGGATSTCGAAAKNAGSRIQGKAPDSCARKLVARRIGSGRWPEAGQTTHCELPESASCTYSKLTCSGALAENAGTTMAAKDASNMVAPASQGSATSERPRARCTSAKSGASGLRSKAASTAIKGSARAPKP